MHYFKKGTIIGLWLAVAPGFCGVSLDSVISHVKTYHAGVDSLAGDLRSHPRSDTSISPDTEALVLRYLTQSDSFANRFKNILIKIVSTQKHADHVALQQMVDEKNAARQAVASLARNTYVRAEYKLFGKTIGKDLMEHFVGQLKAMNAYMDCKYFTDNPSTNFLEGWLNTHIGLFKNNDRYYKTYSVSPWEIACRVEPILIFPRQSKGQIGGLLCMGTIFHLFPEIQIDNSNDVEIRNTFWSSWIKRTGIKIGAGMYGNSVVYDFTAGAALQVWSLSGWFLYYKKSGQYYPGFAIGLSDVTILKKIVPFL